MTTLDGFNQILTHAHSGQWLYVNRSNKLTLTHGYWDKFCVCVIDLCSGFTMTKNTQQMVARIFSDEIHYFETGDPFRMRKPLSYIPDIQKYRSTISLLAKVRLVWNSSWSLPEFNPRTIGSLSLEEDINAIEEILYLIPPTQKNLSDIKDVLKLISDWKKKSFREPLSYSEIQIYQPVQKNPLDTETSFTSIDSWLRIASNIEKYKRIWTKSSSDDLDALTDKEWCYQVGPWKMQPKKLVFDTEGKKESLFYYEMTFETSQVMRIWSKIRPKFREEWEKKYIKTFTKPVLQLIRKQLDTWRRPLLFVFNGSKTILANEKFVQFVYGCMNKLNREANKHPDLFINQFSLFQLMKKSEDKGACLSRMTGNIVEKILTDISPFGFIISPLFPNDVFLSQNLRQELRDYHGQNDCDDSNLNSKNLLVEDEINPFETSESEDDDLFQSIRSHLESIESCLKQLKRSVLVLMMRSEKSHDFNLELRGKMRGCNKETVLQAFPFLNARERNKKLYESFDPNLFKLDAFQEIDITGFEEWVLDALIVFAYTREHPALPSNSENDSKRALNAYYYLLDYLKPGSISIDPQFKSLLFAMCLVRYKKEGVI